MFLQVLLQEQLTLANRKPLSSCCAAEVDVSCSCQTTWSCFLQRSCRLNRKKIKAEFVFQWFQESPWTFTPPQCLSSNTFSSPSFCSRCATHQISDYSNYSITVFKWNKLRTKTVVRTFQLSWKKCSRFSKHDSFSNIITSVTSLTLLPCFYLESDAELKSSCLRISENNST